MKFSLLKNTCTRKIAHIHFHSDRPKGMRGNQPHSLRSVVAPLFQSCLANPLDPAEDPSLHPKMPRRPSATQNLQAPCAFLARQLAPCSTWDGAGSLWSGSPGAREPLGPTEKKPFPSYHPEPGTSSPRPRQPCFLPILPHYTPLEKYTLLHDYYLLIFERSSKPHNNPIALVT